MTIVDAMPRGINPRLTETFLMDMHDVVDASVWWSDGVLCASVTLVDSTELSDRDIQRFCMEELGLHQTPRNVTLYRARRRAA